MTNREEVNGYKHLYRGGIKYVAHTSTLPDNCEHLNGWYVNVKFWMFIKRIYVCSDCGEVTS